MSHLRLPVLHLRVSCSSQGFVVCCAAPSVLCISKTSSMLVFCELSSALFWGGLKFPVHLTVPVPHFCPYLTRMNIMVSFLINVSLVLPLHAMVTCATA